MSQFFFLSPDHHSSFLREVDGRRMYILFLKKYSAIRLLNFRNEKLKEKENIGIRKWACRIFFSYFHIYEHSIFNYVKINFF